MNKKPKYRTQIASDVIRDGLGIELFDENENQLAEIFRYDSDKKITVNTFQSEVPLHVLERLIQKAAFVLINRMKK